MEDLHLPTKRRTAQAPGFEMTKRDVAIVEAIHRYRMMERRQVERLLFQSASGLHTNINRARERLRVLYQHGYLERIPRPIHPTEGSKGPVYRLGANGARFLAKRAEMPLREFRYWGRGDDKDGRRTQVQAIFLEHGLVLTDIRMAFDTAVARHGLVIETWRDEMDLRQDSEPDAVQITTSGQTQPERVPILSDGYFVLSGPKGRAHFFLEADRSTETIRRTWQRKILAYKEYVLSGVFHRRYGVEWPHTPLRILTTALSQQRVQNLKRASQEYGPPQAAQTFLFAALGDVMEKDALTTPIWHRGGTTGAQALL